MHTNVNHLRRDCASTSNGKLIASPRIETVASAANGSENRLTIRDRNTGEKFLIDTGADISVLSTRMFGLTKRTIPAAFKVYAANGTAINIFGERRY